MANPGYDGSRRRLQNLNVPESVIAEIERSHTSLPASITWSSPRDGIVLERGAIEGMKAAAGAVLFRIGDISTMWVLADVPEHDIGFVHSRREGLGPGALAAEPRPMPVASS